MKSNMSNALQGATMPAGTIPAGITMPAGATMPAGNIPEGYDEASVASGTITIVDYTKATLVAATGTFTVTAFGDLVGKTVTVAGNVLTEGVEFTAATDEATTAASLKDAIHALTEVNATNVLGVITITAATAGTAGNSLNLLTDAVSGFTKSGATLTGGQNHLTVTVAGHALVEGTNFTAATSNTATATSLNTAVTALTEVNSTSALGVITVVAPTAGAAGNSITLVTSNTAAATVSGATLTGGDDEEVE